MHPQRLALLQAMPIFGALDESTLDFLVERARPHRVMTGEAFFAEGDVATGMFVIEAGRVAVLRRASGGDVVIRELGPGDCFGEMALMDLQPRSATVRALDECRAFEIGTDDLHALFVRDTAQFALLQMNMGREVCRRLRATDGLLRQMLQERAESLVLPVSHVSPAPPGPPVPRIASSG